MADVMEFRSTASKPEQARELIDVIVADPFYHHLVITASGIT